MKGDRLGRKTRAHKLFRMN
uniref:Uncharacterized protein n=1 Tax=Arundo donax TaxID=35708 RepID=A0A0A9FR87_ARUDO